MTRRWLPFALVASVAPHLLHTGCGVQLELPDDVQAPERSHDVGTSSPAPDAGGGVAAADADAGPPRSAGSACGQKDSDACFACCAAQHAAGAMTYDAVFYGCVCAPPVGTRGVCQTACAASECANKPTGTFIEAKPGDSCSVCEIAATDTGGGCVTALDSACDPDADCKAFRACWNQCP